MAANTKRNPIQNMINDEVQDGSTPEQALELILSERTGERFKIWEFILGTPEFGDFYESDWMQTVQVIGKRFIDDDVELECVEWNVTDVEAELNGNVSLMVFSSEAQVKFVQETQKARETPEEREARKLQDKINEITREFPSKGPLISKLIENWNEQIPSRFGDKDYRTDECGAVEEGVQFVTYISCDAFDGYVEGYEPEDQPEGEGEWVANFTNEDIESTISERLKDLFPSIEFNIDVTDCYGTDIDILITYENLIKASDEDLNNLLKINAEELEMDYIWDSLSDCIEIVWEAEETETEDED